MDSNLHLLSFSGVLKVGVKRMLREQNVPISSYRRLEEAFAHGVLAIKEKLEKERRAGAFSITQVEPSLYSIFPATKILKDSVTGTLEIPLTPHLERPSDYKCAELHLFLEQTGDTAVQTLQALRSVHLQARFGAYCAVELIGVRDPRVCFMQVSAFGQQGFDYCLFLLNRLSSEIDPRRAGMAIETLYPVKRNMWAGYAFEPAVFSTSRQALFAKLWSLLHGKEVFFMEDFLGVYDHVMRDFRP